MHSVVFDSRPLGKVKYLLMESLVVISSHRNSRCFHPSRHILQALLLSSLNFVLIFRVFSADCSQVVQIFQLLVFQEIVPNLIRIPLLLLKHATVELCEFSIEIKVRHTFA